jgi:chemotaxis receptor (MCP) glutamine deamidase CheD
VAGMSSVGSLNVGKRNLLATRSILWKNGVLVHAEATGGAIPRSVAMRLTDGHVEVSSGREVIAVL